MILKLISKVKRFSLLTTSGHLAHLNISAIASPFFPSVDSSGTCEVRRYNILTTLTGQREYGDIVNGTWGLLSRETLILGYNWMLLTSACFHPRRQALVVFKVLQLLEQTQDLLQGDGRHEVQTHSGVLGPITHHKEEEREFKRFRELSSLYGGHMWRDASLQRWINEFFSPDGSPLPVSARSGRIWYAIRPCARIKFHIALICSSRLSWLMILSRLCC